ncbi:hypothetical protein [Cellulosimicrobium marinum]|uniref:hypothetical protein n=1 Tax=Cellulosimicrobium marinum TaxID=1638992 RepID=UPI001E28DEFE|nr:hypothetical protein [Cellulosimicrobium marinum]MCB7138033.1 hypothetical protein [Cellulosimicrobium marinum]
MTTTARTTIRRRGRIAVATATAGLLLVGGCAAPLPTPQPEASPSTPPPVLDETQEADVLAAVGAALQEADEANDPSLLEERVTGPALAIRTSQLEVAKARGDAELVTELPTDVQQVVVPTTQTWPRTSYAVSVQPESLQSPRLTVHEQASARDQYELWGWVRLFPSTTLPSFAAPTLGSEAVAPDDDTLLMSPTDAIAQYADVLNVGSSSSFADAFPDDSFRSLLAERSKLWTDALEPAAGRYKLEFEPDPDEPVRAVRTADGGALVVGEMTSLETMSAEEGAVVPPSTDTEKALFGDADATNVLRVRYVDVVAIYVPPAGGDEQVQVLGTEHVAVTVVPA